MKALQAGPETIMLYGHGEHVDENGCFLSLYPTRKLYGGLEGFRAGCPICQPTVFFKRSLYTLLGPLDESYRTSFDYEYWLRAFSRFPGRIGFVDAVQAQSRLHANCITRNQRRTVALEGVKLGKLWLGEAQQHWVSTHLEEIAREFSDDRNGYRFVEESARFLDEISEYFSASVIETMRQQLAGLRPPS